MSSKRRFGVSIPSDIADALDKLAELTGSDRSSIVAEALRTYLHDHLHYMIPHKCTGFIIVVKKEKNVSPSIVIDKFKDIIQSYNHTHYEGKCIEIFFVSGYSGRIAELDRKLRSMGCSVRYIPLQSINKIEEITKE
ncbi:CopG family ribbon-helix-helix protein [Staphylothermus hellenicus]|uniref:Putative transcriptional regulator, CopG family n=1 Tax=Staphylothermus hellenicus (strain DSM 12710 / JCM 10830 / BK20S6-10-b1 / P8) TaxID=591019 RepID=D7DBL9_STAHD|nr:CopG family ribbon-helix-helix protein [Staphylothermus hellenicus]ADI31566.1 putative transcriptional regulator, CopG family [Staphylothermus hellenicus DSM 12710]